MSLEFLTWWGLGAALGLGVWLLIRVDDRKKAELAAQWAERDAEMNRQYDDLRHQMQSWLP